MRVLVVGAGGSMGRRYMAILKHLQATPVPHDVGDTAIEDESYDLAIIATPTDTHYNFCKYFLEKGIGFLCEKPLGRDPGQTHELACLDEIGLGCVVNNYAFILGESPLIEYDFYNTGKDGLFWDCSQLIYLDVGCTLKDESPTFHLTTNEHLITLDDVGISYVSMVRAFLEGDHKSLWNLDDGDKMTQAVLERIKDEGYRRHSSPE